MLKDAIKKWQIQRHCEHEKHQWEFCTWGSAFVDNLDGTFGLWEISTRTCGCCKRHELYLKHGWEKARKGLTIDDLKYKIRI